MGIKSHIFDLITLLLWNLTKKALRQYDSFKYAYAFAARDREPRRQAKEYLVHV